MSRKRKSVTDNYESFSTKILKGELSRRGLITTALLGHGSHDIFVSRLKAHDSGDVLPMRYSVKKKYCENDQLERETSFLGLFSMLPLEILSLIFMMMTSYEDLCTLSVTCKFFRWFVALKVVKEHLRKYMLEMASDDQEMRRRISSLKRECFTMKVYSYIHFDRKYSTRW